jgi:hypothetical protein
VRALRRTPGFAITAVLVAALGVGANTAVFSLADFVLVRPLPFADPARLVKIFQTTPGGGWNECSPANVRDWGTLSARSRGWRRPRSAGEPGRHGRAARSADGARHARALRRARRVARLGRAFAPARTKPTVVLSDALWRTQFGADPAVLGRVVRLNGVPHTVLGVMPRSFRYPHSNIEAWAPLLLTEENFVDRDDTYLEVVARCARGVPRRARGHGPRERAARTAVPATNKDLRAWVIGMRDEVGADHGCWCWHCAARALCILVLACANLASLFLARGLHRGHELAVRAALGAGRERLVRQLVTESLGLAVVGGVVGVGAAAVGLPLLARLVPEGLPLAGHATLDLRVLAFATLLVLVTGFAFGLGPALSAARTTPLGALVAGSRATRARTHRIRAALIGRRGGGLGRAARRLRALDPRHAAGSSHAIPASPTAHVLAVRTPLPQKPLRHHPAAGGVLRPRARARARAPGRGERRVRAGLPMSMRGGIWKATVAGEPPALEGEDDVGMRYATHSTSRRSGSRRTGAGTCRVGHAIRAVRGRGQRIVHPPPLARAGPARAQVQARERGPHVVGVVGDVRVRGLEQTSEPQVYLPPAQVADSSIIGYTPKELVVRTAGSLDPLSLVPAIRGIVRAVDPEQPLAKVRRLEDIVENDTAPRTTQLRLLGALALIALLIAGLGIHGLLTFTVSMRERELGNPPRVGRRGRRHRRPGDARGVLLAAAGIAAGIVFGYAAARGMAALLVGVRPEDPLTLGAGRAALPGHRRGREPAARAPRRARGPDDGVAQRVVAASRDGVDSGLPSPRRRPDRR